LFRRDRDGLSSTRMDNVVYSCDKLFPNKTIRMARMPLGIPTPLLLISFDKYRRIHVKEMIIWSIPEKGVLL